MGSVPKKLELKSSSSAKKIQSPLAKYNGSGQLVCVLCNTQVKSELFWTGHVNGKQHREALHILKSGGAGAAAAGKKRPGDTLGSSPAKKAGISQAQAPEPDRVFKKPFAKVQPPKSNAQILLEMESQSMDYEHEPSTEHTPNSNFQEDEEQISTDPETPSISSDADLPEGFFDDPKQDAKARGLEFKNPDEIEWENFVKEIAGEQIKSSSMRVEDEEESTKSRELDEIEEQMAHWQKVMELERKAAEIRNRGIPQPNPNPSSKVDSRNGGSGNGNRTEDFSDSDSEYDEELDWRAKQNH